MKKLFLGIIGGACAAFALTVYFNGSYAQAQDDKTYHQLGLFGDVFERIRSTYVEEIDEEELIESALNGMLSSLDPHSSYLNSDSFTRMRTQTRGEFGGLGIEVTLENGYVKVVAPIDDTPAFRAGVQSGDVVIEVDGESTLGLTLDENVKKMRGEVGSDIVITVVREGVDDPFEITITRDIIKVRAVRARNIGETVILRVSSFTDQTYINLEDSIKKQTEELGGLDNVNGYILDLRNNPGGLLKQSILVSDAFLDKGEIVSTRGRSEEDGERWNAKVGDLTQGKPVIVLINGGSASASEIVAGALKDHQRAIVIGTPSFGKGSVQTIIPLPGGDGAIRLTTARYYTPSGRSIQELGVSPDIWVEQRISELPEEAAEGEEEETPRARRNEGSLRGSLDNDGLSEEEREQLEAERAEQEEAAKLRDEDYQLAYALDILKGFNAINSEK